MTQWVRQSTAQTIRFGPFVDSTDGVSPEAALTIAQGDMLLSKDGGAFAQKSAAGNATADGTDGWYSTDLSATDTNTLGILKMQVNVAGALPVWETWMVVPANVYDSFFGTDRLHVDALEISGSETAANNVEANIGNLDVAVSGRATPAQVATALTDIHLDHLLAADYDPVSKPGISTALLNELVESDAGVSRFTANALEQAPAGGGGGSGDWSLGEKEQIRQALGLTGTKTATSGGNLDDVKAKTDSLAFTGSDVKATLDGETVSISGTKQTLDALNDVSSADILTTALSESYAADGAAPTLSQAVMAIQQFLQERSVNGATVTVRRLDGTNTAMTFAMDSDTAPTSITRTT